jgi:hypothetical protein
MFLEKGALDDCTAMQGIVRALALSCVGETAVDLPANQGPPPVRSIDDVAALELWVERASIVMQVVAQGMYLIDLPHSVVDAAKARRSDDSAVGKGTRGRILLELGKNINDIEQGMANVTSEFRRLRSAIAKTRIDLEAAALTAEAEELQLALQKLEIDRQLAREEAAKARVFTDGVIKGLGAGVTSALTTPGGASAATAALAAGPLAGVVVLGVTTALNLWEAAGVSADLERDLGLLRQQADILTALGDNGQGQHDNRVRDALQSLTDASDSIHEALEGHFRQLQDGRSDALINLNTLRGAESKAKIALAKASRADAVDLGGGNVIPLPVNTVLRRQFDILKLRYERALGGAKRAAYLARLAIEERLGTRMGDLRESIGPIEAPALWVDDLCGVQGIDYNALRQARTGADNPPAGGSAPGELDLIRGFADQFIGDYVARLKEFVEFYNLRYPFREADDTAVVSLREDLGHLADQCVRESKNLLHYSDRLEATPPDSLTARAGWAATGCTSSECLLVRAGAGLTTDLGALLGPPKDTGSASWLTAVPREPITDVTEEDGVNPGPVEPPIEEGPAPPMTVYQTVTLRAGTRYVLSWWDIARSASGGPYTSMSPPARYSVSVSTADWAPVAYQSFTPSTGASWGERRELVLSAVSNGEYHVAFGVGQSGGPGASVGIANVQLEELRGDSPGATAYEPTGERRLVLSGSCGFDDPKKFRDRFSYRCDGTACWHELDELFLVDTEVLNQGVSSLVGKVAAGNYNYRHNGMAVNLVGTGVLDCSNGRPSCYGSAYAEYDLTHYAFNVPMIDYVGDVRCFNFGAGNIRSGKALAAERYITVPLGSADQQLVSQPAFLKPEFAGRPLSGAYRLRIKDSPALVWENVDDVQLMFNYRYWSRVDRGPGQ